MWKDSTGLLLRGKMYWRPNAFGGGGRPGGQLGYVPTAAPMRGLWGGIGPMGCGLGTLHVALAHTRFGGCRWRVQSRRWLRCPPRVPEQLARGLKAVRVFESRFFPSIFSFQSSRVVLGFFSQAFLHSLENSGLVFKGKPRVLHVWANLGEERGRRIADDPRSQTACSVARAVSIFWACGAENKAARDMGGHGRRQFSVLVTGFLKMPLVQHRLVVGGLLGQGLTDN